MDVEQYQTKWISLFINNSADALYGLRADLCDEYSYLFPLFLLLIFFSSFSYSSISSSISFVIVICLLLFDINKELISFLLSFISSNYQEQSFCFSQSLWMFSYVSCFFLLIIILTNNIIIAEFYVADTNENLLYEFSPSPSSIFFNFYNLHYNHIIIIYYYISLLFHLLFLLL